jgi:oxygen-dependent protoporphyrinogen oxidase
MIGGIQAGRVDDLSAATVFPALYAAARRGGSLQRAIRPAPVATSTPPTPLFYSLRGGLGSLPKRLDALVRSRGVDVRTAHRVTGITRGTTRRWAVATATTTTEADAVIVTTPAFVTGELLGHLDPALRALSTIPRATTAMVTFAVDRHSAPLPTHGTGFLVPLETPFRDGESMIITAGTLLDRKWPSLVDNETVLIRVHAGRSDDERAAMLSDDELIERVRQELAVILGSWPEARDVIVQRWPVALPQYLVGHADLVRRAHQAAEERYLWLAGMAYDGVGVPASIGSGRRAGRTVAATLT